MGFLKMDECEKKPWKLMYNLMIYEGVAAEGKGAPQHK